MFNWVGSFLQSIINYFKSLIDNVKAFFSFIFDLIKNLWDYFCDLFVKAFDYFLDLGPRLFEYAVQGLITLFPESQGPINEAVSAIAPYGAFINSWVPLDLISSCITSYLIFLGVYITVVWIIRLIPTIG